MAISARMAAANARQGISSPSSSSSTGSSGGQAYTFQSNGQTFTATPNSNITAAQSSAVANDSRFKAVGPGGVAPVSNTIDASVLDANNAASQKINFGNFESLLKNYTGTVNGLSTVNPDGTPKSLDQQTSDAQDGAANNQIAILMKQMSEPAPSGIDSYKKAQNESGILQKQQEVNNLTGQLNQIVATSQANQLAETGQGRGIPESIIGGRQAQIAKEAAIQSLPIAAQLAAAQGNLAMAEQNMNTLFKIYSDDATNAYNRKTKMYDVFANIVGKSDQNRIDALQKQSDRAYSEQQASLKSQQDFAMMALSNGQSSLFSKISRLDPKSATYKSDLIGLTSKIAKEVVASPPTVKSINGVDMQWNPNSQKWEAIAADGAGNQEQAQKSLDNLTWLRDTAKSALDSEIVGASGRSGARRLVESTLVGATDYTQLVSYTNSLKTNVLSLMTDPAIKKFFGPQMSNADVQLMTSAGTTLNTELNTPAMMKTEINRLDDLFNRMQTSVKNGMNGNGAGVEVTSPTGEKIIITN